MEEVPMAITHARHHRGGLSTMAYILWFAAAMFCALVATFVLLARNPAQSDPNQPDKPVPHDLPTQYG
jgi:hypothetical protein